MDPAPRLDHDDRQKFCRTTAPSINNSPRGPGGGGRGPGMADVRYGWLTRQHRMRCKQNSEKAAFNRNTAKLDARKTCSEYTRFHSKLPVIFSTGTSLALRRDRCGGISKLYTVFQNFIQSVQPEFQPNGYLFRIHSTFSVKTGQWPNFGSLRCR